nr:hypothetical protein [Tanacetum cinerariifolium]
TKSKSPIRRYITPSPSPQTSSLPSRVTAAQAPVVSVAQDMQGKWGNPQYALKDKGVINSGCSRHMTGNMSYLSDFEELNGGYVAFGGNPKGGKISSKGKIKTVFSFADTECLVLSFDFKLPNESQVLLRVPRENNMYNVNLKNIVPSGDLTCLFAKATIDESNLWHRRLGHINFKTINKLVKSNLVRGLPTKVFENENTCVACKKGKKHRASCKTKPDETSPILKTFITGLENQLSLKVKVIKSDNGIEFKNSDLNQFCGMKGIKREFSVPRTPQQNGIAEGKNKTLIEAARTMMADSLLPILFWAEAVNTTCYVQNRVLVTKPHNKTPYELLHGRTPSIGFMRPFGCHVTILNTLDSLMKDFWLDTLPNVVGSGPTWLFDIDSLTRTMNYQPVNAGNQTNPSAGFQDTFGVEKAGEEIDQQYVLFPMWSSGSTNPQNNNEDAAFDGKEHDLIFYCNVAGSIVPTVGQNFLNSTNTFSAADLEDITYSNDENAVGAEADFNNLETSITVSPIPTTRIHKDHPVSQISGDLSSTTQTRSITRVVKDQGGLSQMFNDDFHTCMFVCFLSQKEPKRVHQALKDPSWIEAMQEELLQFKMHKVLVLVDLHQGKRAIGTKWVYKNKKDERGIVVRKKARLVV